MIAEMAVKCAWCDEILRPGNMDNVSHGCCCTCKNKYFPCLGEASDCQMELISQGHERAYAGASPNSDICHVDILECKVCKRIEKPELYSCDCSDEE